MLSNPLSRRVAVVLVATAALALAGPAVGASAAPPLTLDCHNLTSGTQKVVAGVSTRLDAYCLSSAWAITVSAEHGATTIDHYGWITYTSEAGYHGADTITVRASIRRDGSGDLTSTIAIAVDGPATAADQAFTVAANGTLRSTLLPMPGGEWMVEAGTTPPAHGTLSVNAYTGEMIYQPEPEFTGVDGFLYRLSTKDGAYSNVAHVTITVR
ncbi:Ig-like domain-containing protein [Herbiconiux sp. 11R-BC]|uniref:Ig-like domain-containing protein n=1 Tax=Herbiconiux sp. 11R-BC TaxID=3111637 RepID=UPI003BFD063A